MPALVSAAAAASPPMPPPTTAAVSPFPISTCPSAPAVGTTALSHRRICREKPWRFIRAANYRTGNRLALSARPGRRRFRPGQPADGRHREDAEGHGDGPGGAARQGGGGADE